MDLKIIIDEFGELINYVIDEKCTYLTYENEIRVVVRAKVVVLD